MINDNINLYNEIRDAQPAEAATEGGNPDIDSLDSQFLKHVETESSQRPEEVKVAEEVSKKPPIVVGGHISS